MHSNFLELVIVTASMLTEAYSVLDLTKAKCSISKLSIVANENVTA
jgi:hypothetical protein